MRHDAYDEHGYVQASLNTARYNASQVAFAAVRDIEIMRRCSAFVGTLSSNFGRLVHELQSADLGAPAPLRAMEKSYSKWFVFP